MPQNQSRRSSVTILSYATTNTYYSPFMFLPVLPWFYCTFAHILAPFSFLAFFFLSSWHGSFWHNISSSTLTRLSNEVNLTTSPWKRVVCLAMSRCCFLRLLDCDRSIRLASRGQSARSCVGGLIVRYCTYCRRSQPYKSNASYFARHGRIFYTGRAAIG